MYIIHHQALSKVSDASSMVAMEEHSRDQGRLQDKTVLVTGGNAGLGKEISRWLLANGATVYMACRNEQRGRAALDELIEGTDADKSKGHLLIGDCGVKSDVERIAKEFQDRSEGKLDALIINAGALAHDNKVTLVPKTDDQVQFEATFATHLLFGCYHLTNLLVPTLNQAAEPRVVMVSSGGMYNTKVPISVDEMSTEWESKVSRSETGAASEVKKAKFDGQMAYCYAKRGQVNLCEKWTDSEQFPDRSNIKFMSCHPGWVDTPGIYTLSLRDIWLTPLFCKGVAAAYGDNPKMLQPLRSLWEGVHGILWLAVAGASELQGNLFALTSNVPR